MALARGYAMAHHRLALVSFVIQFKNERPTEILQAVKCHIL